MYELFIDLQTQIPIIFRLKLLNILVQLLKLLNTPHLLYVVM